MMTKTVVFTCVDSRHFSHGLIPMLLSALPLLLLLHLSPVQDATADFKKNTTAIVTALDAFCLQARKVNGTVSSYQVDGTNKKLTQKTVLKADKSRNMTLEYNADQRFVKGLVFREYGDMRQALVLDYDRGTKGPRLQIDFYAKKGEKFVNFDYENDVNRVFAYDSPTTYALRPIPQLKLSFVDLLDYPAFKITSVENIDGKEGKLIKVTFKVDQEINAKQTEENRLNDLKQGWIEVRPDQFWTVLRSEYILGGARGPTRNWKADFTYDQGKNVIPLLKQITMATIDQKANTELKLLSRQIDFDFKIVEGALPDDQFSLTQFGIPERTAEEGLAILAERKKRESLDELNPPSPPSGFAIAKKGIEVSPWVWLGSGLVAIILVIFLINRTLSMKKVQS